MSKLLNYAVVNAQALGGAANGIGIRIGSIVLTPAAAIGTVSISDSTGVIFTLSAPANAGSIVHTFADDDGVATTGPTTLTTTGVGINVSIELM